MLACNCLSLHTHFLSHCAWVSFHSSPLLFTRRRCGCRLRRLRRLRLLLSLCLDSSRTKESQESEQHDMALAAVHKDLPHSTTCSDRTSAESGKQTLISTQPAPRPCFSFFPPAFFCLGAVKNVKTRGVVESSTKHTRTQTRSAKITQKGSISLNFLQ